MPNLKVESNGYYKADPLYQWDLNQTLYIYGVSIVKPVIHFSNKSMVMSIVRQPKVDISGVISVMIPNSLLQKNEPIYVYICRNEGDTFKTYYKLEIAVKSRPKPADYTLELDDGEVYSFVNLEQEFNEIVGDFLELTKNVDERVNYCEKVSNTHTGDVKDLKQAVINLNNSITKLSDVLYARVPLWNIDGKLVLINEVALTLLSSRNQSIGTVITNTASIPMINSGEIQLRFGVKVNNNYGKTHDGTYCRLYKNNEVIYHGGLADVDGYGVTDIVLNVIVNKGDILKFETQAIRTGGSYEPADIAEISNINFYANEDSIPRYIDLNVYLDQVATTMSEE